MKILNRCRDWIDTMNETIGGAVSWLTSILVLVVTYDVVSRYVFRRSFVSVQELQWHLFATVFLLGSAYTWKHNKHVRVDVIYSRLSSKGKACIDLLGTILLLIPFALVIIWTSKNFVINSFAIRETSPDPGGLPGRFIMKATIPLAFILVFFQGLSIIWTSLVTLVGPVAKPTRDSD